MNGKTPTKISRTSISLAICRAW